MQEHLERPPEGNGSPVADSQPTPAHDELIEALYYLVKAPPEELPKNADNAAVVIGADKTVHIANEGLPEDMPVRKDQENPGDTGIDSLSPPI